MKVRVLMFAGARDLCENDSVDVTLPERATIGDLRSALLSDFPPIGRILPYCRFAIDESYVKDDVVVESDSEIACIPPVSGG